MKITVTYRKETDDYEAWPDIHPEIHGEGMTEDEAIHYMLEEVREKERTWARKLKEISWVPGENLERLHRLLKEEPGLAGADTRE